MSKAAWEIAAPTFAELYGPDQLRDDAARGAGCVLCATCGKPITSFEDAWVEWLPERRGLRVVHHRMVTGIRGENDGCCYSRKVVPIDYGSTLSAFRNQAERIAGVYGFTRAEMAPILDAANRLSPVKDKPRRKPTARTSGTKYKNKDTWNEDDPIGVKRQRLVKWLMSKQGVELERAKLIASRKYRY